MHGLAFALLTLTLPAEPLDLVYDRGDITKEQGLDGQVIEETVDLKDAVTFPFRKMKIPFSVEPKEIAQIESVKLYFSTDGGKRWQVAESCKPTERCFTYTAPRDGLYLFAIQIVYKNGKSKPAQLDKRAVGLKILVDTEHKVAKPR